MICTMKKALLLLAAVALFVMPGCNDEERPAAKPQPTKNAPPAQPKGDSC
jgi:outer membrane biogenesis lipoprotein LolB